LTRTRKLGILACALLGLAAVAAVATTATGSWRVRTSLLDLLPKGDGRMRDVLSLVEGRTGRELVVAVGHPDADSSALLAAGLRSALDSAGATDRSDDRAPEGMERAYWETLVAHLPRLLPDSLALAADRTDTALLARQILSGLYLPYSVLPPSRDPFQIGQSRMAGLSRPGWALCGRRPCREVGGTTWTLVRIHLPAGAFDGDLQARLVPVLSRKRSGIEAAGGKIACQGVVLHAARGREQTESDLNRIAAGSVLGILLVLWAAFRSPLPFLAGLVPVVAGMLAGIALVHAAFGGIHATTLAFGASITGLCADYALFLMVRRAFDGEAWDPEAAVRTHWNPLLLGLLTTLLSFAGLAASGFPGLVEVAAFAFAGLTTSWICAMAFLPAVFRGPSPAPRGVIPFLGKTESVFRSGRLRAATAVLALLAAAGSVRLRGDDDVRRLQSPAPDLVREDSLVGSLLRDGGEGPLLLVEGRDPEDLLRRLESTDSLLRAERARGRATSWISLSQSIPSARRQAADSLRVEALLRPPLRDVPVALGIEPSALDSFARLQRAGGPRLGLREWLASDASWGARDLLVDTAPWRAVVTVEGCAPGWKPPASPEWMVPIDPAKLYTSLLAGQRRRSALLVLAMYVVILAGLGWLMGPRRAFAVVAPPFLAAAATLGLLGWLGIPLHFFGVMALALVLGAGVDYSLFLEAKTSDDPAGHSAVILCAATALLGLGTLALSSSPALSQFGLVSTFGLAWSMLLAPWAPRLSRGSTR
jgi:predicted exporter